MVIAMEKDLLRALPWYQCFMRVRVGPASCAMLINCYSSMNFVSKTVVDALNLPLIEHSEPYEFWLTDKFDQDHASRRSSFPLCGYGDLVVCDVLPMHMHVSSILLGKPWTDLRQLSYHYDGEFSFVWKGRLILLDSYTLERYKADRQRRDHALEAIDVKVLNDQDKAGMDIQHAEFLASTVSADAYAETIYLTPRRVSFQGGEDDMANTRSICTVDHHYIQEVGLV